MMIDLVPLGERAKKAAQFIAITGTEVRNAALYAMAQALERDTAHIVQENEKDLSAARESGQSAAFLDRLSLDEAGVQTIAQATRDVARLKDPVGALEEGHTLANGLRIFKTRVPFGVIGMIYEARPNVTADAAALCVKSGNACLLRGSREAFHTNSAMSTALRAGLVDAGLPADCVQLVDASRESAAAMMALKGYIDLLIPRGGRSLIRAVVDNARVPVIETGAGNCHIYVDRYADLEMAVRILDNAKTSRPSVCNACETVLVHTEVAQAFFPAAKQALDRSGVEWRGCEKTCAILPGIETAQEEDWGAEYNDYILAARVVKNLDEAIAHIARYSTGHSESIITRDYTNAMAFTGRVDSAAVYVNASTRFTDGSVFGLGAEIGISTQKLHTRGPMGLHELTADKYVILGDGQVR